MSTPLYRQNRNRLEILSPDRNAIVQGLNDYALDGSTRGRLLVNNGIYRHNPDAMLPSVLGAAQYVWENHARRGDTFLYAVNSNDSVAKLNEKLEAKGITPQPCPDQAERMAVLGDALCDAYPDMRFAFILYDEETPAELYRHLKGNLREGALALIYKFGYTDIPGSRYFDEVLSLENPLDKTPDAKSVTPGGDASKPAKLTDLMTVRGGHGLPYLSATDGKPLFPLRGPAARHVSPHAVPGAYPGVYKVMGLRP